MASSHPNPTEDYDSCFNSRFLSYFPRCKIAPVRAVSGYCEHCILDGFGRNEDRDLTLFLRTLYYRRPERPTGSRASETGPFVHESSTRTGAAPGTHTGNTAQPLVLNNCQVRNLFNNTDRDSHPPIHPPPSALLPPGQYFSHMGHNHNSREPQPYLGLWPLPPRPVNTTLHERRDLAYPIYGDPTPRPSPFGTPPPPSPLGTPPPQGERARPIWRCPDNVPTPVHPDPPRRPEKPYCPEERYPDNVPTPVHPDPPRRPEKPYCPEERCSDNEPTPVYPSPPQRPEKPYCPEEEEEEEEDEAGCKSSSGDSEPDSSEGEGDLKGDPKGKSRRNMWERGIRGVRHGLRRPDWVGGGGAKLPVVVDGPVRGGELPRRGSGLSLEAEGDWNGGAKLPTVVGVPVRGGEPLRPASGLSLEMEAEKEGAPERSGSAVEALVAM